MGNATYGMIAKLVGVSDVAVYKWIKKAAEKLPEPMQDEATQIIQIDEYAVTVGALLRPEMWHFVNGKTKFGSQKAFDPVNKKLIGFEIRKRHDKTCQKLCDKLNLQGKSILTDDWDAYHRLNSSRPTFYRVRFNL